MHKKGKKYVVRSHMSDKAYKKAHDKLSEEVKKLALELENVKKFTEGLNIKKTL